jgi:hypothetical protein
MLAFAASMKAVKQLAGLCNVRRCCKTRPDPEDFRDPEDFPKTSLLCIWQSAPLGVLIAEVVRRKLLDKRPAHRSNALCRQRSAANA